MAKKVADKCSFCGRTKDEVDMLIAGSSGHICDLCVGQATNIIKEEAAKAPRSLPKIDLKKPAIIKAHLDEYVIGQEAAKRTLSVAVYNHYKRLLNPPKKGAEIELDKSNVILVGETGTGKTLLAKTIARFLDVPFCIADATVLTEAGYVGEDVESVLSRLLQASDYDIETTERGIVFIDEIDKIARKNDNPSITRDVSGEGVQQALLKLLEGTEVNVPPQGGRKHPEQKLIKINTQNILFICGGAFSGIDQMIERRYKQSTIGFKLRSSVGVGEDILSHTSPADLKSYGLIPELVGRFPVLTYLSKLDKDALRRILTEPKNALIKQYMLLFELDGIKLKFNAEALDWAVDKAVEFKLGARGLRGILESLLTQAMFELPGSDVKEFVVDRKYCEEQEINPNNPGLKVA